MPFTVTVLAVDAFCCFVMVTELVRLDGSTVLLSMAGSEDSSGKFDSMLDFHGDFLSGFVLGMETVDL